MADTFGGKRRYPRLEESHTLLVRTLCPRSVEGLYKTGDLGSGGLEFTMFH